MEYILLKVCFISIVCVFSETAYYYYYFTLSNVDIFIFAYKQFTYAKKKKNYKTGLNYIIGS